MSETRKEVEKIEEQAKQETAEIRDAMVQSYTAWFTEILGQLDSTTELKPEERIEAATAIIKEVGKAKREEKIGKRKLKLQGMRNSGGSSDGKSGDGPRPGVREFLKENKDENDFYQSLWESLQEYGRLSENQYDAIKDDL